MSRPIICEQCHKVIEEKEDLVTASIFFRVKPYHYFCYGKDVRGARSVFFTNHPLNGISGHISYLLALLMTVALFLFTKSFIKYIALVYLITETGLRIYAYCTYSRHLKM